MIISVRWFLILAWVICFTQCTITERISQTQPPARVDDSAAFQRHIISALLKQHLPSALHGTVMAEGVAVRIEPGNDELKLHNPSKFDTIEVIQKAEAKNHVEHLVQGDGEGVPLVMMQEYHKEKASPSKLFPLNGRHLPATAYLEREGSGYVLRFYHTRNLTTAEFNKKKVKLAYDLSTPLERSMSKSWFRHTGIQGLLHSDRYLEDAGIYLPDVYDPNKIPVVFVHGLNSDPHIWQNSMNEVIHDPALRSKYQCWYFLYPTGLPIYASAARLRMMLHEARDFYDPTHTNANMKRMVLVGHSMGGIISRMQAIDSGNDFYDSFFIKPLDNIPLMPLTKDVIRKTMYFDRVPFVNRVVFVASPHQGSEVAEIPIMRLMNLLVHPTSLLDTVVMDLRVNGASALNPELWKFRNLGCRSVQTLSPHHPLLEALKNRKIQTPYHTIIARKQRNRDLVHTTDGVVAYWSSHINHPISEKAITGSHSCTNHPEVSAEILRILKLHLHEK